MLLSAIIWAALISNLVLGALTNLIDDSASISSSAAQYSSSYPRNAAIDGDLDSTFWTGSVNWNDGEVSAVQITLGGGS